MKRFLFLVLFLAFVGIAQAQPNQKVLIYTDTTLAGQVNTAAGQIAVLARGYTGFTKLKDDIHYYNDRKLIISFRGKTSRTLAAATSFTLDSVKIQGLLQKTASPNTMDSVWVDIPITFEKWAYGINTASGLGEYRDTTLTWMSAGAVGNTRGYVSPQFTLPAYYDAYRVVNGLNDSGRVVIKQVFLPRW
jgi:hypothetical protein